MYTFFLHSFMEVTPGIELIRNRQKQAKKNTDKRSKEDNFWEGFGGGTLLSEESGFFFVFWS